MQDEAKHDYAMERRLRDLNPELHRRFTDAVFALQYNLSNYKLIFPEYTDHSNLHSMTVIDFCNQLIGNQIERLNADELYALLMGCYFHDTGMGITRRDYEEFSVQIDFRDYFDTHSIDDLPGTIRSFHNEFSGCFIRKYAELFEIPSETHLWAVIQISRGHRKTDLLDEQEYPRAFIGRGQASAVIDVAAARNPILLYDIETLTDAVEIIENKKVKAVRELLVSEDEFVLRVDRSDAEILGQIRKMVGKMQKTLDNCREAVRQRSPYVITQQRVRIEEIC